MVSRCYPVVITKCRTCIGEGDTLQTVATELGVSWLYLVAINPSLSAPNELNIGSVVYTGATYRARERDTVESVSVKFGVPVVRLLRDNRELRPGVALGGGEAICVRTELA